MKRILLSAAEASGDLLAADLVEGLVSRMPGASFHGIAGPAMRAAGVEALACVEDLSVMGAAELWKRRGAIFHARRTMIEAIGAGADGLVVVDSPDLNIPLARIAKRKGIPVIFYVSPQVWAWRKGRAREIAELATEVLCLFDFEPEYYRRWGGRAQVVGHPVVERVAFSSPGHGYALLPGSRVSEVERLLPVMSEVVGILRKTEGDVPIRMGVAKEIGMAWMEARVRQLGMESVVLAEGLEAAAGPSAACLVCSGTATLELACMGRPMVVVYKAHPLTWWLGRVLVRGVEYVALPNILLDRPAVPERLQHLDPQVLVGLLQGAQGDSEQIAALGAVRERLGSAGAGERAAERTAVVFDRRVTG